MRADFDLGALHNALDAKRTAEDLSWAGVARAINSRFDAMPATRAVSASTISGVGRRSTAEGDGVLQMLLWLDRTPESFVPGHPLADAPEARLAAAPPDSILRFDRVALHTAMDKARSALDVSWQEIAVEVGCTPGQLTSLASSGRVVFPMVMRLTGWLEAPAARFTRPSPW